MTKIKKTFINENFTSQLTVKLPNRVVMHKRGCLTVMQLGYYYLSAVIVTVTANLKREEDHL